MEFDKEKWNNTKEIKKSILREKIGDYHARTVNTFHNSSIPTYNVRI